MQGFTSTLYYFTKTTNLQVPKKKITFFNKNFPKKKIIIIIQVKISTWTYLKILKEKFQTAHEYF